jgi:hypothetical protein
MVAQSRRQKQSVEAVIVSRQATALLQRLVANRETAAEQVQEPDPMKVATGRSAIDGAILMARHIVKHTDELLHELQYDDAC